MNNINELKDRRLRVGKIIDIKREMLNLIVFYIQIGDKIFQHKIWGHVRTTENMTQDQYENYLEYEDNYIKNKFWHKFNLDFEDRDLLIGRKCYCHKNEWRGKPYLKLEKVV